MRQNNAREGEPLRSRSFSSLGSLDADDSKPPFMRLIRARQTVGKNAGVIGTQSPVLEIEHSEGNSSGGSWVGGSYFVDGEYLKLSTRLAQNEAERTRRNGGVRIRYGLFGPLPDSTKK